MSVIAATFATLIAAVLVEENVRGDRAWESYRRQLLSQGERLDLDSFRPPAIAEARNFCRAPALALLLYKQPDDHQRSKRLAQTNLTRFTGVNIYRPRERNFGAVRNEMSRWSQLPGGPTDEPAADVLRGLTHVRPLLDEVRDAALTRPDAALEPEANPATKSTFDAAIVFAAAQLMALRAAAEVEIGNSSDSFSDVFTLQRLANALVDRPETMMRFLVGIAIHGLAADVIEHGCSTHRWSDPQLREFQRQLDGSHPVANLRNALQAERAHVIYLVDTRPKASTPEFSWPRWMFHGWAQQNKVSYSRDLQDEILSNFDADAERIRPSSDEITAHANTDAVFPPFSWLSRLALGWIKKVVASLGSSFDRLNLTKIGCAIERHRVAHGYLPRSLDELTPSFITAIPNGTFDGKSARISEDPVSGFQIYFVGRNGRDDRGREDDVALKLPSR